MRDYLGDFIHLFWFLFMYSFVGLISSAQLSKGCMVSGREDDVLKGNVVFIPIKRDFDKYKPNIFRLCETF